MVGRGELLGFPASYGSRWGGQARFRVAGGALENQDCVLSPRYFDELPGYVLPNNRPELRLSTRGFNAPQLLDVDFLNGCFP